VKYGGKLEIEEVRMEVVSGGGTERDVRKAWMDNVL